MSENAEKKENRKLCPFGWTHCAKEVCEWWLEFANSCAIPLTACILADSTICQNVWERESRWTEQEVKDAKAIRRILPEARDIERITETLTVVRDEDGFCLLTLQKDMFPNVKEGPAVKLTDIIGGNE